MPIADYFIFAMLGLAPSLIWLLYYLHQDCRPEPKKIVLQIFLLGALAGPLAILAQMALRWLASPTANWQIFTQTLDQRNILFFLNIILFAPLTEEFLKFAVVRWRILKDPAFDEPFDAMLYLIISALGFAAVENLLYIFLAPNLTLGNAFSQILARFLSATFLHTIASGILGYFLALSWQRFHQQKYIFFFGFLAAIGVHSCYNYLAWLIDADKVYSLWLLALLAVSGIIVHWQLHSLKHKLSICKV